MILSKFYREHAKNATAGKFTVSSLCMVKLRTHFNAAVYITMFHFRSDNERPAIIYN
jgi:hypothetical protein